MTLEEAQKLAYVFANADGGCPSCARGQCTDANNLNLGFHWDYHGNVSHRLWEDYDPTHNYGIDVQQVN